MRSKYLNYYILNCRLILFSLFVWMVHATFAQITGEVVDANDGGPVPYASVSYRGNSVAVSCDGEGRFSIPRHQGWAMTISAVGYVPHVINVTSSTPKHLVVRLSQESQRIQEVTVKSKKAKYSRKNNPAVELMRKVIAQRKHNHLKNHDYYQFNNYQKITFGLNDLTPATIGQGIFKKNQWLLNQVEVSPYNNKLVLPISVEETVSQEYYRKSPEVERKVIMGQSSKGVNDLFQTGDILNAVLKDVFADIDIYDDQIRILRHAFTSPIGRDAIAFYRYYITDTVYVGNDRCYHLDFTPNNQQDFGFRGQLYIMADSSYQVRRCQLTIPSTSEVNWVENMQCLQEFVQMDNGEWVLGIDDMFVELMMTDFLQKAMVVRNTRRTGFSFDPLPEQVLKGNKQVVKDPYAEMRDDGFWAQYRQVELTRSESSMDKFIKGMEQMKGFKYIIFAMRALFENYVETGTKEHPSKVDIGPINTIVSQNFYDKWRLRASAQTTANLHPHLFLKGYYARGMESRQNYYNGEVTYTFNRPEYLPREFPKQAITFQSMRDVAMPSDKFVTTDKDNVFTSFKVTDIDKMFLYNRQAFNFEYEKEWGIKYFVEAKTEKVEPIGSMELKRLSDQALLSSVRYTETTMGIRLAPGESYVNTKQRRHVLNKEATVMELKHTMGFNGLLGGHYDYNFTEASFFKRIWLPMAWGKLDTHVKAGVQWNQVPYPLLIMPAANLSYILQRETFNLINNMEFLNDRYASLMIDWDMSGKLFNRIPLLRHLKWREWIGVKCLWGGLSDKNNPLLPQNSNSAVLMEFPDGAYNIMDSHKPYWEASVGIHNIFRILQIQYVRRLSYLDRPSVSKQGIRVLINVTF